MAAITAVFSFAWPLIGAGSGLLRAQAIAVSALMLGAVAFGLYGSLFETILSAAKTPLAAAAL